MINISRDFKDLYNQDNVYKELILYIPELDLTITNDQIVDKSFTLTESLCSNTDLTFGSCEAAMVEITIADVELDISNKTMIVTQIVDSTYEMPLGTYTINSALRQSDRRFKKITAFDYMTKTDIDISAWYNALTFPITVKSMRESLLTFIGVDYVSQTLTNDTVTLAKSINPSSLTARDILRRLCEINAGFGHITRDNKFKVIQLTGLGLYPSESLYPSEDLFPAESGVVIPTGSYRNIEYSEYIVEPITLLKIQQDDEDSGVTSGTGTNPYIISGNYLLFGKTGTELQAISDAIFLQIKNKYYRPHTTSIKGIPYLEVGDSVLTITKNDAIESFAFKRIMTGVHSLVDTLSATGNQYRSQTVGINTQIQRLNSKSLIIKKSVDELSTTITEISEDLQSQITQQAGLISLKVSKGDVSSQLSIEPDTITLNSNRLIVNSTKFQLDASGNATFSGTVSGATITSTGAGNGTTTIIGGEFKSGGSTYTTTIKNGQIYANYISISQGGSQYLNLYAGGILMNGGQLTVQNGGSISMQSGTSITCNNINGSTPITAGNRDDYLTLLYDSNGGGAQVTSTGNNFRPHSNYGSNSVSCGSPSYLWTQVFAASTTISSSDKNLKQQIASIEEVEKRVALKIKSLFTKFKFNDAVNSKGDKARIHIGVIAQDVKKAFEEEGLNPYDYAMFCSDTWYEKNGSAVDENENMYTKDDEGVTEVTQLGIRYEELLCFIIAAM